MRKQQSVRVLSHQEATRAGYTFSHGANNRVNRTQDKTLNYARALQNTSCGRDSYAVVDRGEGAEGVRYVIYIHDN